MRFLVILLRWLFARKFGDDECGWETENRSSRKKFPQEIPAEQLIFIKYSYLLQIQRTSSRYNLFILEMERSSDTK
jgi:hypothetical protein